MQDSPDPRPQRMQMSSRYRRFAASNVILHRSSAAVEYELHSERHGYSKRALSEQDFQLAQLYDGTRDATAICTLALSSLNLKIVPLQLEGFAAELAEFGLLFPGTHEPLPVFAYTEHEARELGWTGLTPGLAGRPVAAMPLPPSSVPGSRGNPGLVIGPEGYKPGAALLADRIFPAGLLMATGRWFNWPLVSIYALVSALLLVVTIASALIAHRLEFVQTLSGLWTSGQAVPAALLLTGLVHWISTGARAHAVTRYSPEEPRCVLRFGFLKIPFLLVDSSGVIQRASQRDRLRMMGAALMATSLLIVYAGLAWLILGPTHPRLGQYLALLIGVAAISWVLRINPLANRDGYMLLSHGLGIVDLREQAGLAILGVGRPWSQQLRKLPRGMLAVYAILSVSFVLAVLVFSLSQTGHLIGGYFGGTGFVLFAGLIGAYMFRQLTKDRITAVRDTLGWKKKDWRPTRRTQLIAAVAVVLCCFPYRYEPSGDLVVLPSARADVRALVAGDVQEVLVAEGDEVAAGQVIAQLRDDESRSRVAQSQATLAQLQADLAVFKRGAKDEEVEVARQRVATARKRAEVSSENAKRLKQAFDKQSITAFEYDRARGNADVDAQSLLEAQRALELTASPAMADQISAKEEQVKAATATLDFNRKQLADASIKAPITGRIVSGSLKFSVGTFLRQGDLLAIVEDSSALLAEIKLPESSVGEIKTGNGASAKVWAYPGTTFNGSVRSVAPAAEAGEYGKVVRVQMSLEDPDGLLKPEMTGSAKAQGDRHLAIVVFTRALRRFIFIEVWSWLP